MTTQKIYYCHIIVHFMYVFKRPGNGISRRKKKEKKRESVCTIHTCVPSGTDGYIHMYVAGLIRMYAHYSMYVQLPFEKLYKYIYRYLTKYVFAQWLLKERKKRKKKHESPALPKR